MRATIQRVSESSVKVNGKVIGEIGNGLMVLLGIEQADNTEDIEWLVRKISNLRIFDDEDGVMNKSLIDVSGEILLISQFTLHASYKKGNRPSYIKAAKPDQSVPLYEESIEAFKKVLGSDKVETGEFGADMKVSLVNDGPVTINMDTKNKE
ncbi:D-aminoacyl-tRNA deacylase [Mangrovivirga sp. M17]|uniref:D-aminoacyl-tRNA deacylase n=1 Tax=Mangrovivirga halotolerans TaxID=2993936 RepID=A0ABT3RWF6_9BACT|nr:D-aminoacyl-tRNA deacylase [Mangrovivirga halotolerans]MCX2745983.1 D-aminoacyl-tRNA deacylase [Mangrovivirga halotolerans]